MMRFDGQRMSRLILSAMLFAIAGCADRNASNITPVLDYSRIRALTGFYEGFLSEHRSRPPRDEQEFRTYIATKQEYLDKEGLTVDDLFVSPRSGGALQWVYGRRPPSLRQTGMTVYAYEVEPVDGKRLVIGGRGMFQDIDEAQFRALFPKVPK